MQYLLTEEEYNSLKGSVVNGISKELIKKAQFEFAKTLTVGQMTTDKFNTITITVETLQHACNVFDKIIAAG